MLVGNRQYEVVAGLLDIIVVGIGAAVQRTLSDGVNHHGAAAAGLRIAVVVGAADTADLVGVLCLAAVVGLINIVEQRYELSVNIDLALFKSVDLDTTDTLFTGVDVVGCGSDLGTVLCVLILGDLTADLFGSCLGSGSGHIGVPYLINIVAFPCVDGEHDLLGVCDVLLINGGTVGHCAVHDREVGILGIGAVVLFLLCGDLILNGSGTVIDIDIGGSLGVSVDGRGICHRGGLGGSIGIQVDAAAGHNGCSLIAVVIDEIITGRNVSLVVVLSKGNCHGTDQLALILVSGTGGTHGRGLALIGSGAVALTEGCGDLCVSADHGEDVLAVFIGSHFFGNGSLAGGSLVQRFDDDQLCQLVAPGGSHINQNLLTVHCQAGIHTDGAGNGGSDFINGTGGNGEDILAGLLGILGCFKGLGAAAVGIVHRTLDAGTAVDGTGTQSGRLFIFLQLSEVNNQLDRCVGHREGDVRGFGSLLAGGVNQNLGLINAIGLIGVADCDTLDGVAAVGDCTDGDRVTGVGLDGRGNRTVDGRIGIDLQIAAGDLVHTLLHQTVEFFKADQGEHLGNGCILDHAQDTGHDAGNGTKVHGLALTVGILHGSLCQSLCLFDGLAGDVDIRAGGQPCGFGNQRSAVLLHHGHRKEAAEAEAAFRCGRCGHHNGAGIAGAADGRHHFLGGILLRNGGHIGVGFGSQVDAAACVDLTFSGGFRIHKHKAQCQRQGDQTDGRNRRGCNICLTAKACAAAGGNAAGLSQIGPGIRGDDHNGYRETEPLVEFVVGLDIDAGGCFRIHSAAGIQCTLDADVSRTDLDRHGEGYLCKITQLEVEDRLGLNTGCGQRNVVYRIECCGLCDEDSRIGGKIEIPEIEIDTGLRITHAQRSLLRECVGIVIACLDDDVVRTDRTVDGDLLAVDFQIQTGHIDVAQFQSLAGNHEGCEVKLLAVSCLHGQGVALLCGEAQSIIGKGVGYHDGTVILNHAVFNDLDGLVGDAVSQCIDFVCVDGDQLAGLAGSLDHEVAVDDLIGFTVDSLFPNGVGIVGVDLAADGQDIVAFAAVHIQSGDGVGGVHVHIDAVGTCAGIDGNGSLLAAALRGTDCHAVITLAAFHGDGNRFTAVQLHIDFVRTGAAVDHQIAAAGGCCGNRIIAVTGIDGTGAGTTLGIGDGIVFAGAVDGDTGIALCFHNRIDGEVQARHDQFKLIGCVDDHIAVDMGCTLAFGADGVLVDNLAAVISIGIFRQDVDFKTVLQMVRIGTGCIHNDVAVVVARAHHDGDVVAVRIGSCDCIRDCLADGILGGCLSGSDISIVRGVLRRVVVILLQRAILRAGQFRLNLFGRCDTLVGAFNDDIIGDGLTAGLNLIETVHLCGGLVGTAGAAGFGIIYIGRFQSLVGYAVIVIDLSLNHNGEIVDIGQVILFLVTLKQSVQIIFLLTVFIGHHIFNDDRTAFRCHDFFLSDILGFRNRIFLALLRHGSNGQKCAKHTQAERQHQKSGNALPQFTHEFFSSVIFTTWSCHNYPSCFMKHKAAMLHGIIIYYNNVGTSSKSSPWQRDTCTYT